MLNLFQHLLEIFKIDPDPPAGGQDDTYPKKT